MKLTALKRDKRRGRPRVIGGERINFFPGDVRQKMDDIEKRRKDLKLPGKLTYAYILRQGALMFIEKMSNEFDRALKGEFHAKKRKPALIGNKP